MSFSAFSRAVHIFFSCTAATTRDKSLFEKLKAHLSSLKRRGLIDELRDNENTTRDNLEQSVDLADINVLLISPEFLNSAYCYEIEMKRALERNMTNKAPLILVLLRPTDLKGTPLEQYRRLPLNGKSLSQSSDIDAALLEVVSQIGNIAEELVTTKGICSYSTIQLSLNTTPYGHSPFFTDRVAILTSLHNYFASCAALEQTCVQALHGLAGIGKTQIAVEYVYLHKHEYQTILWLAATSRIHLKDQIIALAEQLSLTNQDLTDERNLFNAFKRWLQQHDNWLLILDNLEDITQVELFVPLQTTGHVLLTTLAQATGHVAHAVPVAEMTVDDSVLFLLRRAKIIDTQTVIDKTSTHVIDATSIVQEVGGLSLALDQAGAYIEESSCGLARYLRLYHQQTTKMLEKRGLAQVHRNSVAVTLSLNSEKVHRAHPDTLKLLQLFAFLQHDAIPDEMIELGAHVLDSPLHKLAADSLALDQALTLLLSYALIQRRIETKALSIHRVVQVILKGKLTAKQRRQWAQQAVRLVSSVFPVAEFNNWSTCEKYFSQARHCIELIREFGLFQKETIYLGLHLGEYCYQRAYYQDAEAYLTDVLKWCEQTIEADDLDTAYALNRLASVYHKQGRYQEAEKQYQRAWALRENVWGTEHPDVAQIINNLALLYKDWGRYQQAETLHQQAITIYEHTLGLDDDPEVAIALNNLALVYDELGKSSQATSLYQRAFSIEERTLDMKHPDMALSMNNLAARYEEQGNYLQAEALYKRTITIQEQIFGKEHPDLAQSMNNLAGLYEVLGRYQEAEKLYEGALHIYEAVLGEHPETARVLNNLAYLLCQQSQYQEAEKLYERALHIYEAVLGEHPDVASILNNLGTLYHLIGKDEIAEPLLRRGLTICEQVLGEHIDTARSLKALIDVLMEQRRYEEVEPLYRRNLNIIQQALGPSDPDVALAAEEYKILLDHINEQKDR